MNELYELLQKLNVISFKTEGNDITPLASLKTLTQDFFKHYSPDSIKELTDATNKTLSSEISYRADYRRIESPRIVSIDAENIQLETNEPFQALLWSFCYHVFLFYEMTAQLKATELRTVIADDERITDRMIIRSGNLFKGIYKSKDENSFIWHNSSPNPSEFSNLIDSEEYYCKKANGLYMVATSFFLFHELGHYAHNDLTVVKPDKIKMEQDADLYAIHIMNHPFAPNNDFETQLGIVLGVGSLLFFSSDPHNIIQFDHPNTPDRIIEDTSEVIKQFGGKRENDIWWFLVVIYSLFYEIHDIIVPGPFDYPKEAVEYFREDLLERFQP